MTTTNAVSHTPGPWRVERGAFGFVIMGKWPDPSVASQNVDIRLADMPQEEWDAETEANAKVMAASPVLLQALKALTAWLGDVYGTDGESMQDAAELASWARKVISEAQ